MKTSIKTLIVALFCTLSLSANAEDPGSVGLYTSGVFALRPVNKINEILNTFHEETPDKNIVLYIHGRGRHVDEEWQMISNLEKVHNVRVVMFHWPSWSSLLTRPVENAKASADELSVVLHGIKTYKEEHPEIFERKKLTLLTHSMGHIVLREYTEKLYARDLNEVYGKPLFDNYISAAADIGLTDHKAWLSRIDFAVHKHVLMNNRDLMLIMSYLLDLKAKQPLLYKLGLGFGKIPSKRRADFQDPEAIYIDLSKSLQTDHRYFESDKPIMRKLFTPMLNGEVFAPKDLTKARVKEEDNIFYVID
mgnify:CR=1 FL=1